MPELPEVETTCRGIRPYVEGQRVTKVTVRQPRLRWPVPKRLAQQLQGQRIRGVRRRAKYILLETDKGSVIIHLGMSGSLRILERAEKPRKHDHVDIVFEDGHLLRLHDPRRFGALLWVKGPPEEHELLLHLGPEPLAAEFDGDYLWERSRKRKAAIKTFVMDSRIVVGVGNIYANEALFLAGIDPRRAAGRISRERYRRLAEAIKQVLRTSIKQGGTTLRDFVNGEGNPGYFQQQLRVYGRTGEPCRNCGRALRLVTLGQRSTFFCGHCQR